MAIAVAVMLSGSMTLLLTGREAVEGSTLNRKPYLRLGPTLGS